MTLTVSHTFPLFSLLFCILLIAYASEFYAWISTISGLIFVIIFQSGDSLSWFFLYEVSLLTVVSALSIEGRSFRRFFALLVLLMISFSGTSLFLGILSSTLSINLPNLNLFLLLAVISTKIPTFPWSFWLPEAHVEATWPGSVALAVFALKFSLFAIFLFTITGILSMGLLELCLFSALLSLFAVASIADVKKLIANLSVIHMNLGILVGCSTGNFISTSIFQNWNHHSIITGLLFAIFGIIYAISGSRLFRFSTTGAAVAPVFSLLWLLLFSFSLDLPWAANSIFEAQIVRNLGSISGILVMSLIFILIFVFTFSAVLKSSVNRSSRALLLFLDTRILFCWLLFLGVVTANFGFFLV